MNGMKRLEIINLKSTFAVLAIGLLGGYGFSKYLRKSGQFIVSSVRSITTSNSQDKKKKSLIYTKTGDSGSSSLYNGERRQKTDPIFDTLGAVDELNACLGIAREHCEIADNGLELMLAEIQSRLFDLGAAVATPSTSSERKRNYTEFPSSFTLQLEELIDEIDSELPPLKNFVIPSGGLSATHLNLARAVCRRSERAAIILFQDGQADAEVVKYLNRLSDLLFVASRAAAMREGRKEIIWKKAPVS